MRPEVSIIVPTFREVENLSELVRRISGALNETSLLGEIIIVDDDSRDGTIQVCETLSKSYPLVLETRVGERGLATAVLHGLKKARGQVLAVMDADLSHPPEAIPEIVNEIRSGADMVVGSRYVSGGKTEEDWGLLRWLNSKIATVLARPLTNIKDPMAGFFAIHRNVFMRSERLDPIGYKIGLELLVKCGCRRVVEVPIHFIDRKRGKSKLTLREQWNYVAHLRRLYTFKFALPKRAIPIKPVFAPKNARHEF